MGKLPDKKLLSLPDSVSIILAITLGVGIFRVPSIVAGYLPDASWLFLVWFAGGVISLCGSLCYAELACLFPKSGGTYIYLKHAYGEPAAFLFGWSEFFVIRTGSIAAMAFLFAEFAQSFLSLQSAYVKPIAIAILFFTIYINTRGLKTGAHVINGFNLVKVAAILVFIACGFLSGKGTAANFFFDGHLEPAKLLPSFGLALIPVLWAYGGWHENTFMTEETEAYRRTMPLALTLGILLITTIYLLANGLYVYILPMDKLRQTPAVGSAVLNVLVGGFGKKIFDLFIMVFSFGSLNAMMMTGSRITQAMARDHAFFGFMTEREGAENPVRSIMITGIWSLVLILLGNFNDLLFFTGILVWVFFGMAVFGIFILRKKKPELERPYRVFGYPVLPAFFVLVCLALVLNSLILYTKQSVIGLGIALAGMACYFLFSGKRK